VIALHLHPRRLSLYFVCRSRLLPAPYNQRQPTTLTAPISRVREVVRRAQLSSAVARQARSPLLSLSAVAVHCCSLAPLHRPNRCRRRCCRSRYRSRPTLDPRSRPRHHPRRRRRRRRCPCRRPPTPAAPLFWPHPRSHRLSKRRSLPLATRRRLPHIAADAAPHSPPSTLARSPPPFAAMVTPHPAESRPTSVSPPPRDPTSPPSMPSHDGPTTSPLQPPAIHPRRWTHQTSSTEAAGRLLAPRCFLDPVQPVASPPHPSSSRPRRRRRLLSPARRASDPPPLVRSPRVPSTINNLVVPPSPTLPLHPSSSPPTRLCLNRPPRDYPLELQLP
jgi:hypothetical protein